MPKYEGQQTLREIMEWILAHRKDTSAMDRISRATYPFTTHFLNKTMAEATDIILGEEDENQNNSN
jgi:hypothetical protein